MICATVVSFQIGSHPMASRRLLILTSTMPAREGDGTPAFVADLSAQLAEDFEVRILAPAVPGAPGRARLDDRVEVIRYRYFQMSFVKSCIQVIIGGALVFAAGVLIGNA